MKVVIQPCTYGDAIKRTLRGLGNTISEVGPILVLSALCFLRYIGYLEESVDLFLKVFCIIYACSVLTALYTIPQAVLTPLYGVKKGDILKWMEGNKLDTAFENHTLHVRTITEGVPYFNAKNILGAILVAITMPSCLRRIKLYEGVCYLEELKVSVVKPSALAANFSFGHELGHIVQALHFFEHPPLVATAADLSDIPKMSYHDSPDKQVLSSPLEKLLYMEWEADLHAIYFGISSLNLDAEALVDQLTANRLPISNYHFRYHLSMTYLPVLIHSAHSLQDVENCPTWEEFIESAYQKIPANELMQWREILAPIITEDNVESCINAQGKALFKEKLSRTESFNS